MPRKRAHQEPPQRDAITAACELADIDRRTVLVDPAFAERLTTHHTRRFTASLERTNAGPAEFTRDVPNVGEEALAHLDAGGLAIPGSPVRPGTILVGKATPHGDGPLTPEEKLLRAIFGEKAGDTRDTSLRASARITGTVAEASVVGERAEVVVAWDRALEVGDVLLVDDEPLVVADLRPLSADLARAGGGRTASVVKDATARDALRARSIGPYDSLDQPIRDDDGLAGQVPGAGALASLATAAPWAAWELLTIKADSPGGRVRLYESLCKGERPDVAPRSGASIPARTFQRHDIFSFFDQEPAPAPGEVAALQPEVVGQIALHLRALGLEVDLRSRAVGVAFLSSAQVLAGSCGEVREANDLTSQKLFGPIADYKCACGKHTRMRDRGVVCDECGVEVIQSRVRRERCGHIELAAPCVHPLLSGAPRRKGRARDEPAIVGESSPLRTLVVLPPALRGPAIDAAYARVLAADADGLQAAVAALFVAIADIVDRTLHPRLYSKAVDFSGAAHLVVDSSLDRGDCRVPRALLLELFRPHAYGHLELHGHATTIKSARRMVDDERPAALDAIAEASEGYPVLLMSGKTVVARRVRAWDAPAIAVDAATADALAARVVTLHVPLAHEAAVTVADMDDPSPARPSESVGWLAQARRDGRLVDAALRAAVSDERDPVDDPMVHLALGRAPEPVDEPSLEHWQAAETTRQQAVRERLAEARADDPAPSPVHPHLDRSVDELELSVRTANGLANLGVTTLRDLCARTEADLLRSKQFGPKSLAELREILAELGLSLGMADV